MEGHPGGALSCISGGGGGLSLAIFKENQRYQSVVSWSCLSFIFTPKSSEKKKNVSYDIFGCISSKVPRQLQWR